MDNPPREGGSCEQLMTNTRSSWTGCTSWQKRTGEGSYYSVEVRMAMVHWDPVRRAGMFEEMRYSKE